MTPTQSPDNLRDPTPERIAEIRESCRNGKHEWSDVDDLLAHIATLTAHSATLAAQDGKEASP